MRASEVLKRNALPFAAGIGTGSYLLFWAPQDQMGVASALAPVAAIAAFFTPDGAAYALPVALNGLAYLAVGGAIRSTWATRRWLSVVLMGFVVFWVGSASVNQVFAHQLHPYTEVVLKPGMKLTARTPNGALTILAGR
jgi:hypothetical protein